MVVFKNVRISLLNVKTWKKSFGETPDRKTSTVPKCVYVRQTEYMCSTLPTLAQ